jgi:hypothetical protein
MRVAALILATTVLLGACSDGSDPGPAVEGTEIIRGTTTTIPPAPHLQSTTTVPVQLLPPTQVNRSDKASKLSWEGQRFDVGVIKKVAPAGNGWVVAFDREEVVDATGTHSGKQLTTNPVGGQIKPPTLRNSSHAITFFNVSPDAPVNELTPDCTGSTLPSGVGETVPDLATYGVGTNNVDSLTFDATGQVTVILLTQSC